MSRAPEAFFQPAMRGGGHRLYLHHSPPPGTQAKAALLYAHPWAEEMNKSRRMAALASRALADAGHAVLQVDLLGCGDSSGDFADATWEAWLDDLQQAAQWLQERHPQAMLWLWGLRVGALLTSALAERLAAANDAVPNLLFWQPTLQGKTAWQQFLRLKAAAQLADGGGKAVLEAARADLDAGRTIEVAGYEVSPALARRLECAVLNPPAFTGTPGQIVWLELGSESDGTARPIAAAAASNWERAGWTVTWRAVPGSAFWQTVEIEEAPAWVETTVSELNS